MACLRKATNVYILKLTAFLFLDMSPSMKVFFLFRLRNQHRRSPPTSVAYSLWLPVLAPNFHSSQPLHSSANNPSPNLSTASNSNLIITPSTSGPTPPCSTGPASPSLVGSPLHSSHTWPSAAETQAPPLISEAQTPLPSTAEPSHSQSPFVISLSAFTHPMVTHTRDRTRKPKLFPDHVALLTTSS